jgi:hypothetical protein
MEADTHGEGVFSKVPATADASLTTDPINIMIRACFKIDVSTPARGGVFPKSEFLLGYGKSQVSPLRIPLSWK